MKFSGTAIDMKKLGMNGNQLKIIAMLAMLSDHVGRGLLPQYGLLTAIGRLAFPIFAYMIAEGCRHTRSRARYLIMIAAVGVACQAVYFAATGSMYMNILITFSLSVMTIYAIDAFLKCRSLQSTLTMAITLAGVAAVTIILPEVIGGDFAVDYGFFGVLLPPAVYFAKTKEAKLVMAAGVLAALSHNMGGNQWCAFFAIPLLMLYNGERGRKSMKYLFYIFYPVHLAVIYLLQSI